MLQHDTKMQRPLRNVTAISFVSYALCNTNAMTAALQESDIGLQRLSPAVISGSQASQKKSAGQRTNEAIINIPMETDPLVGDGDSSSTISIESGAPRNQERRKTNRQPKLLPKKELN
jgi:hypothetical protein